MDRHQLKHDKFVQEVGHSYQFAASHRSDLIKYGSIALAILIVGAGWYFYSQHQNDVREQALGEAIHVQEGAVGEAPNEYMKSYPTQAAKDKAAEAAFGDVIKKYPGSREAVIAHFYLGTDYADAGRQADAEREWKIVVDQGDKNYSSQGKLSLAQLYETQNRTAEADKLLHDLMNNPTVMVSKEQAIFALAHIYAKSDPKQARKLLEPLRTERSAVSRMAITAIGELPPPR